MLCAGLGTFVTYNPTTVSLETELAQAMRLMDQHLFRHLPVVDEKRNLVGVISDLDVARALLAQRAWQAHLPAGHVEQICHMADVLVRSPCTVDVEQSPRSALLTILEMGFHSLPVTEEGKLVGILTSSDYLRELSYDELPGYREAVVDHMSEANVSISAAASIDEAGEKMQQSGREQLVVASGDHPLGIVALRDVRRATETGTAATPPSTAGSVRKLLTGEAATILLDCCLGDAATKMLDHRAKSLAVVDQSNHLCGLLTEDDLLLAVANEWAD